MNRSTSLFWGIVFALITAGQAAFALPNLTPYMPSGWSDKIVVSTTTGTTTDNSPLYTADTLYVDWAVVNNGTTAAGAFYVYIYVDGVYKTYYTVGSLNANTYTYASDYSIGSLSAGTHTITITADPTLAIAESNESDNSYTKTITVSSLPNLTPYQPSGWSDKIVVSTTTGTTTDNSPLLTTDTLYVDWAVINNGNAAAGAFYTSLYVDGVFKSSWYTASLSSTYYASISDYNIGSLSAGTHTLTITADSGFSVVEGNESDNSYTKTIAVTQLQPDLTPYQPPSWADKIVVARNTGTTTDSSTLTPVDTLYVNWAVINNGNAAAGAFSTSLYVDGVFNHSWNTTSLSSGYYTYANDFSIGSLSPGSHTITITADSGLSVAESNESNNSYTKTIYVYAPNLTPNQPTGWSDKIVVSTTIGTTTDSATLSTADTLYVDWSVINNGSVATASRFYTAIYVDGVFKTSWFTDPPLAASGTAFVNDYSIGSLTAGTHTITVTADYTGTIVESNEGDNSYTKTITVQSLLAAPTLSAPANGSTGQSLTPTFSWSSVPNATSYRIMVATVASDLPTAPTVSTGGPSVVINDTPTGLSDVSTTTLNAGTTYYWEVHGRSASLYGAWSGIYSFTTVSPSIRISPLTLTFSGSAPSAVVTPAAAVASVSPTISSAELLASVPMEQKLTDISSIYQGFTNSGITRVLVHVAIPTNGVGKMDIESASAMKERRNKVHGAQQKVLDKMGGSDLMVRHRFENILAFSADVSLQGLKALQADPSVVAIEPVIDLQEHLAQGIPLIHGMTYRSSFNGSGMAIAICDSGVDYTHARLGGGGFPNSKVIGGYNFGDGTSDPMPNGIAHGTCCAGIAAGDLGTVGDYIGGVAYNAKLYALKITAGGNSTAANDAMVAAWDWCVTHKNDNPNYPIMVISTSFGGDRYFSACDSAVPSMTLAANNAVAAGITVLASSGNDGYCDSIAWPACISSVISVGAVYDASFGQFDPCVNANSCVVKYAGGCASGYYAVDNTAADQVTSYANTASFLTLLAPGNKCYTLDIVGAAGESTGDYYDSFGGTSAACPYAAGAVACLQSAAKARTGSFLTPQEVKNRLVTYGDNITDTKAPITKPRVNLERAIQSLPGAGQTFRIYNDGTGKLTVNSITTETSAPWITFGPAGPFDVVSGGYQDVTVSVDFSQAPVGQSSVRLLVASTDSSKNPYPSGVYVSTTRLVPAISVTPASQDFGSVVVGTTADRTFSVQNSGSGTLAGSASVPSPFSIVSGGTYSLGASASQTVTVRYSPAATGTDNQSVTFTGAAGATRSVSGSAYVPAPIYLSGIALSNSVIHFVANGPVGSNCVTTVSSNLINWTPLYTNVIPVSGSILINDPGMSNQPRRFYRVIIR